MFTEYVDLTYPIRDGMPSFSAPWHATVEVKRLGRIEEVGRETRSIRVGTHSGTHVDAPLHFVHGGAGIDTIALEVLVGPVQIVDLTHVPFGAEVSAVELGPSHLSKRLILRYGWGCKWGGDAFYREVPYLSLEAADRILEEGVLLIGMDTPSPDSIGLVGPLETDSPVHKRLLKAGVVVVEYLANLDSLPDLQGWTLVALPMLVAGGDGAPARVFLARTSSGRTERVCGTLE